MEHNTLFKLVYTFILGIVIALFFGIGIAAFYEQPKPPEYESSTALYKTSEPSVEQQKIDHIVALERLQQLRDKGALTEAEFEQQKSKILKASVDQS